MPFSCAASSASAICLAIADRLVDGNRSALQALGEILALDELEHQVRLPVRFLEAVDGGDVGVVERGEDLRLALETSEPLGIARHIGGQHLDRHLAVELGVGRPVDLAHSARAEGRDDLVRAEPHATRQAHGQRRRSHRTPVASSRGGFTRLLLLWIGSGRV